MSRNRGLRWNKKLLQHNKQNGICYYCKKPMQLKGDKNHPSYATWDHLLPRMRGGTSHHDNIVLACFLCNHEKGILTKNEYMKFLYWRKLLQQGHTITRTIHGQSITTLMNSGQKVTMIPFTETTPLEEGDVVFCKVAGNFYIHKVLKIESKLKKCSERFQRGGEKIFQIGNNHGHINGWAQQIYGKVINVED